MYAFARLQPDLEFLVAYTANGSNLNGYTPDEMAGVFALCPIPHNMVFEENFAKLIERVCYVANPSLP
jgi:hypothetical protein